MEVWPVIHINDRESARRNFSIATAAGCTGVFLIAMDGNNDAVDNIGRELITNPWGMKVGVNYLGVPPQLAIDRSISLGYHATWTDLHLFNEGEEHQSVWPISERIRGTSHKFFAGVAFKGQTEDMDAPKSALRACARGFIPTTSGPGTGHPPTVTKVMMMRQIMGEPIGRLAIASGLEPENIATFAPYITHALVATGISHTFYDFDPYKLRRFMEAARTR